MTYGIPATVFLILDSEEDALYRLKSLVVFGLCWILVYAGMFICKPLIGSLIVHDNLFPDFFSRLLFRVDSNNYSSFSRINAVTKNVRYFTGSLSFSFLLAAACISFAVLIVFLLTQKRSRHKSLGLLQKSVPFLLISVSPVCWFFVLANHCYIHTFFAHKALYISVFALACMLTKICTALHEGSKKTEVK